MLLGIGLALSFLIMALYFQRLALHHLPNAEVTRNPCTPACPMQGSSQKSTNLAHLDEKRLGRPSYAPCLAQGPRRCLLRVTVRGCIENAEASENWHSVQASCVAACAHVPLDNIRFLSDCGCDSAADPSCRCACRHSCRWARADRAPSPSSSSAASAGRS